MLMPSWFLFLEKDWNLISIQQLNITSSTNHNFEFCEGFDDMIKWQTLFIWNSLAMSNIIDAYCVYFCAQEVKKHTEETKEMTSKKAYINRKR